MSAPLPTHQTTPDLDGLRMVLAAVLEAPATQVDPSYWKCATSGCAVGWFCTFNPDDRLKLKVRHNSEYGTIIPFLGDLEAMAAVDARFRLTSKQSDHLFGSWICDGGPRNRLQLIERLEQFIVDNTPDTHVIPDLHELRGGRSRVTDVFSLDLLTDAEVAAFAPPANVDEQPLVLGTLNAQAYDEAHQRADAQEEDGERWDTANELEKA